MIKNLALNELFSLQTNRKKKRKKVNTPFDEIFFAENKNQLKNLYQAKQKNTKIKNPNINNNPPKHNNKDISHRKSKSVSDISRIITYQNKYISYVKSEKFIKENIKGKILFYKPKNNKEPIDNHKIPQTPLENIKTKLTNTKEKQYIKSENKLTTSSYKNNQISLLQFLNTKMSTKYSKKSSSTGSSISEEKLTFYKTKKNNIKLENQILKTKAQHIKQISNQKTRLNFYENKDKNITQINVQQISTLNEHIKEKNIKATINGKIDNHITDKTFTHQQTKKEQNNKAPANNNIKTKIQKELITSQKPTQKVHNQINIKKECVAKNTKISNTKKFSDDITLNVDYNKQNNINLQMTKENSSGIIPKSSNIQRIKINPVKKDNLNYSHKSILINTTDILSQDKVLNQTKQTIQKQKLHTGMHRIFYIKMIDETKKLKTIKKPKSSEKIDLNTENNTLNSTLKIKDFNYQTQNTTIKPKKETNSLKIENNIIIENSLNNEFFEDNTFLSNNKQENEYKNYSSYEKNPLQKADKNQFEITFNYEKISIKTVVRNNYIRLVLNSGFEFKNPESLVKDIENILQNSGFSKINIILKEKPKKVYQSNKTKVTRAIDVKV